MKHQKASEKRIRSESVKKWMQRALCVLGLCLAGIILFWGCIFYETNCKMTVCDTSVSSDRRYELTLIQIGEPAWPFGAASGRLILKEGNTQISKADFELKNDGCSISSSDWAVTWNEDSVEVVLSGEEQFDEQILLYFDGTTQRRTLDNETGPTESQAEIDALDIRVSENRENELVFTISIHDYIRSYNSGYTSSYLTPASQWQCYTCDCTIHSDHETKCYSFTEDQRVYSLPTITVYVPTNGDYIQEITVNFDEHSYSESGYAQYREMCFYTLKVFFPELTDEAILDLCTEIITLGNQNVFSSDEWYGSGAVPYALFHKDGIGVYPYFAIGDWEHLCVIPVTEETIAAFEQEGTIIHEIQ